MRVLLDTQVWLWMQMAPRRLSAETRKLPLPEPPSDYVPSRMRASGTTALPIHHAHVLWTANLPPHHRDPFDRLLVAQAQLENLPLLTADRQLAAYDVQLLRA